MLGVMDPFVPGTTHGAYNSVKGLRVMQAWCCARPRQLLKLRKLSCINQRRLESRKSPTPIKKEKKEPSTTIVLCGEGKKDGSLSSSSLAAYSKVSLAASQQCSEKQGPNI
eukprot:1154955-Pelagomonas_calceolata.AAC.3